VTAMKVIFAICVLLSIVYGLNAYCCGKKHERIEEEDCQSVHFPEPEPKEIHYIYRGETCSCPKYHDVHVEQPIVEQQQQVELRNYEYDSHEPAIKQENKENTTRYLFDVRVEQPEQAPIQS